MKKDHGKIHNILQNLLHEEEQVGLEFVKQAGMKLIIPKPNIVRGTRRVNKNKLLGQIACWCDLHLSNC